MKNVTAKVITISSQLLVVSLFLLLMFTGRGSNNKLITIANNNFEKMADRTSILFKEEEMMTSLATNSVITVLADNTEENILEENIDTLEEDNNSASEDVTENIEEDSISDSENVIETYTGILTGYGPDCVGCGNFNTGKVSTASGYHVANIIDGAIEPAFTITYKDVEYGEVRIVAADANIPFYSIVRITIPGNEPIVAIVLDRGSTVGFENCRSDRGCLTNFDLLYSTEAESLGKTQNVKFELLRSGK